MQRVFYILVFFTLCGFIYAEAGEKKNEYFIYPTLGFGAVGANTGVDFMYRHASGFALFCNLNLAIPLSPLAGMVVHPELYFGYSIKRTNLYISFAGGIWGGAGITYYDYVPRINEHGKYVVERASEMNVLVLFAVRNDYMYFFNEKIGISFSHTHGLGVHYGRWLLEDTIAHYSFLVKTAVAFRL